MADEQPNIDKEAEGNGKGSPKTKTRNGRGRGSKSALVMGCSPWKNVEEGSHTKHIVPRQCRPPNDLPMLKLPTGKVEDAYDNASALERAERPSGQAAGGRVTDTGTRVATHWLSNTMFRKRKKHTIWAGLQWQRPLVVRPRDCKTFGRELLSSIPAVVYTVTALSPLFLDAHPEVQLGLQIANAALLFILMVMGLMAGRFSDENRWYLRHYFIWTIVSHLAAFYFGSYSDLMDDGSQALRALSICRTAQAVQAFPLWSVELFDVERLKIEKSS